MNRDRPRRRAARLWLRAAIGAALTLGVTACGTTHNQHRDDCKTKPNVCFPNDSTSPTTLS